MDRREAMQTFLATTAAMGIVGAESQAVEIPARPWAASMPISERSAHWACDLNEWKWPDDWGEPPDWVIEKFKRSGRDKYEFQKDRYRAVCHGLLEICGHREMLRVHNVVRRGAMTDAEFSKWYDERGVLVF